MEAEMANHKKKSKEINMVQSKRINTIHQAILNKKYPNNPRLRQLIAEAMVNYEENPPSEATINRDIKFMRDELGLNILWDAEQRGYYYPEPPGKCPIQDININDIITLSLIKNLLKNYQDTPLFNEINGIVNYIGSFYECKNSDIIKRIAVAPTPKANIDLDIWEDLWLAMEENQEVEFDYTSQARGVTVHHRVRPYQILLNDGMYYLWGYDLLTRYQGVRLFSFPLIDNLTVSETKFELPVDFEFCNHTGGGKMGIWYGEGSTAYAIKFSGISRNYIKNYQWAEEQEIEDHPEEDYAILRIKSAQWYSVEQLILSMGCQAEPLEPAWLVNWWKEEIRKMAEKAGAID